MNEQNSFDPHMDDVIAQKHRKYDAALSYEKRVEDEHAQASDAAADFSNGLTERKRLIRANADKIQWHNANVEKTGMRVWPAKQEIKAALWDAHEHYLQNKEAYQQAALEDAASEGVEINVDGKQSSFSPFPTPPDTDPTPSPRDAPPSSAPPPPPPVDR